MRPINYITRQEVLNAEIPQACRYTDGQSARAFQSKEGRGWISAMPAEGPPFEMVAFVHQNHQLSNLVKRVRDGQEWFLEDELEAELGGPWMSFWIIPLLAKVGLALAGYKGEEVHLRPADPRAARFINESRRQISCRGYKVQCLIEAFLPIRDPRRSHIKVKDDRRLAVAEILDSIWDVDADDLLSNRLRIRLVSRWTTLQIVEELIEAI